MPFVAWILVLIAGAAEPQPEQFTFQFRNGLADQHKFKLVGPNASQTVRTDAQGLRITLPSQRSNLAPAGVEACFQLRGDFEVTLSYELLAAKPPPPPNGAGVVLRLKFDNPSSRIVTLTRVQRQGTDKSSMDQFGTNLVTPGPDGKNKISTKMFPAKSMQGQLRLARLGEILRFLVSDGPAGDFQEIRSLPIGTEDVKVFQAQCATGGEGASADVRLIALDLSAAKILSLSAGKMLNQPSHFKATSSVGARWHWWAILGCFLLGAAVSFFWLIRRRRASRPGPGIGSS